MFGSAGEKGGSLIGPTVRMVAVIGAVSWFAAAWLSAATDRQAPAQLARQVAQFEEPLTTGSIGSRAAATKLDPCVAPRR